MDTTDTDIPNTCTNQSEAGDACGACSECIRMGEMLRESRFTEDGLRILSTSTFKVDGQTMTLTEVEAPSRFASVPDGNGGFNIAPIWDQPIVEVVDLDTPVPIHTTCGDIVEGDECKTCGPVAPSEIREGVWGA